MLLLLLTACGDKDIVISWETPGCEDWDFQNPPDPYVDAAWEGTQIEIQRVGLMFTPDAVFEPEISLEGHQLEIIEGWTGAEEGTYCVAPTVWVKEIDLSRLDVNWTSLDGELVFSEELRPAN